MNRLCISDDQVMNFKWPTLSTLYNKREKKTALPASQVGLGGQFFIAQHHCDRINPLVHSNHAEVLYGNSSGLIAICNIIY